MTSDELTVNGRVTSSYEVDPFGKVIISDFENAFRSINILDLDRERLRVENDGIVYILEKKN